MEKKIILALAVIAGLNFNGAQGMRRSFAKPVLQGMNHVQNVPSNVQDSFSKLGLRLNATSSIKTIENRFKTRLNRIYRPISTVGSYRAAAITNARKEAINFVAQKEAAALAAANPTKAIILRPANNLAVVSGEAAKLAAANPCKEIMLRPASALAVNPTEQTTASSSLSLWVPIFAPMALFSTFLGQELYSEYCQEQEAK